MVTRVTVPRCPLLPDGDLAHRRAGEHGAMPPPPSTRVAPMNKRHALCVFVSPLSVPVPYTPPAAALRGGVKWLPLLAFVSETFAVGVPQYGVYLEVPHLEFDR